MKRHVSGSMQSCKAFGKPGADDRGQTTTTTGDEFGYAMRVKGSGTNSKKWQSESGRSPRT